VVTECFFERPRELQRLHPDLYVQLKEYYQQDPAARLRGADELPVHH
jgi:Mlc titration factor MtfA (ptsG expression regulator)